MCATVLGASFGKVSNSNVPRSVSTTITGAASEAVAAGWAAAGLAVAGLAVDGAGFAVCGAAAFAGGFAVDEPLCALTSAAANNEATMTTEAPNQARLITSSLQITPGVRREARPTDHAGSKRTRPTTEHQFLGTPVRLRNPRSADAAAG